MADFDLIDRRILALMSEHARMPIAELSKRLRTNRDTIVYRLNRLKKEGFLLKTYAQVNIKALGYTTCHAFFSCQDDIIRMQLIEVLKKHAHTKAITTYTDRWDFEWVFVIKSIEDFDSILMSAIGQYTQQVTEELQLVVIDLYPTTNLPFMFHPEDIIEKKRSGKSYEITDLDVKILSVLVEDAQIPALQIANVLGISTDTVIKRIKGMVDANIIEKFTVDVNREKLGYEKYVLGLQFKHFSREDESKLKEIVRNSEYIIRCARVFGQWDLLVTIVADKHVNFHETAKRIRREFSDIIRDFDTWVADKDIVVNDFPLVLRKAP